MRETRARADVNNMADLMAKIRNIPPNFFADFVSARRKSLFYGTVERRTILFYFQLRAFFLDGLWREFQNFLKKRSRFIMAMFSGAIFV